MDASSNGDGNDIEEGPLDPSVFFGLFDDLGEGTDSRSASEVEPVADGHPSGAVEAEEQETRPASISWWSIAAEEQPANNREVAVASPPPIPPDVGRAETIESLDGADAADTFEDGQPPVVTFTPIETDRSLDGADAQTPEVTAAEDLTESVADTHPVPTADLDRRTDRVTDRTASSIPDGDGGGRMAKAALATIAVGLFAGLIAAFVLSLRSPDAGDPAASTVVEEPPSGLAGAVATGSQPTTQLLAEEFATALPAAISNRLDLTSVRFEPGTTELDERSAGVVTELGVLLAEQPTVPVTVAVRTYTESTPAENFALSSDQADALVTALVVAGAGPDQIRARGLGAAPLSQAQPVPNFVVLTPQFGDRLTEAAIAGGSPFALGVPATATDDVWPLRADGLLTIGELAEALSAFPDTEVGAAGYSFLPPSQAGIRTEADNAAAELADFLVTAYGIDPEQITTIIPGSAVFVPTPEHGNHIWLQIGHASQGAFDVASIDPAAITFEPGSAELDADGLAAAEALADILTTSGATIVVDVRSYEATDAAADQALSEARRDALESALMTAGVAKEQLRMYASGASSHFLADGGSAITITVAP